MGLPRVEPEIKQEVPATGPEIKQEVAATGPEIKQEPGLKEEPAAEAATGPPAKASLADLVAQIQSSTPADQLVDVLAKAILKHAGPALVPSPASLPGSPATPHPPPKQGSPCAVVAEQSPPAKAASPSGPAMGLSPGPLPGTHPSRINSNTYPGEYKAFERFCERNPHAEELRKAYSPEPQYCP